MGASGRTGDTCPNDLTSRVRISSPVTLFASITASLAFALPLLACNRRPTFEKPLNVILVVVDTLRADRMSLYGHKRPTSPYIDKIAAHGLVADRAYSHSPWTMPSMATLFTSTYESTHQLSLAPGQDPDFSVLPPEHVTLAEYFAAHGYRTGAISAQPWVAKQTGFHAGFDDFSLVATTDSPHDGAFVVGETLDWLRRNGSSRFFLYLHFMTPHTPYQPPPPFEQLSWVGKRPAKLEKLAGAKNQQFWDFLAGELQGTGPLRATPEDVEYLLSLYDAEVAQVDWWIGVLHRELRRMGLWENTLVVLVSDHGESFFEHGMFLHGTHLFNENLHVPLLFSHPVLFPEPVRLMQPVGVIDVFPTIVDLLGGKPLAQFQGRSMLSGTAAWSVFSEKRTLREDGRVESMEKLQNKAWSLVHNPDDRWALYRLEDDPGELHDVIDSNEATGSKLRQALLKRQAVNLTSPDRVRRRTTKLDEVTLQRLRALGYLD